MFEPPLHVYHYDFIIYNNDDYLSIIILTILLRHYPAAKILFCIEPYYTTLSFNTYQHGIYRFFDQKLAEYVYRHSNIDLQHLSKTWKHLSAIDQVDIISCHLVDIALRLCGRDKCKAYKAAHPFLPRTRRVSRLYTYNPLTIPYPSLHERSIVIDHNEIQRLTGWRKAIKFVFTPKAYVGFYGTTMIHTGIDHARHLEHNGYIIGRRHLKSNENIHAKRLHDIAAGLLIHEMLNSHKHYQAYRCTIEYDFYRDQSA